MTTKLRARKKELGDWCENGSEDREPKYIHSPVKSVARSMSMRESSAASEAKKGRRKKRPFPHVLWGVRTSLTFWTLYDTFLHMADRPKSHATPTNSNAHVSPVSSKIIEMRGRHTLRKVHLVCTSAIALVQPDSGAVSQQLFPQMLPGSLSHKRRHLEGGGISTKIGGFIWRRWFPKLKGYTQGGV